MIHTQTLIVRFAEEQSIKALSTMLQTKTERIDALKLVRYVVGDKLIEQHPTTLSIMRRIEAALDLTDADIK